MRILSQDDRKTILVGRPLPFSIYGSDCKLLLAAGRIVPNEFVREGLARSGAQRDEEAEESSKLSGTYSQLPSGPLAELQADYKHTAARARVGFRMEREGLALQTRVIGVSEDGRGLILSGPTSTEGLEARVREGEKWTFRALYATAAVRFQATVEQLAETPFRFFSVLNITDVDRRNVRAWPRVLTSTWTARPGEIPRMATDISVGGARIAAQSNTPLQQGQLLLLNPSLKLATGVRIVSVDATVLNLYGHIDSRHPQIDFYGVRFEKLSDLDRLVLHAYVQESLSLELDRVWQVLTIPGSA
jgi:hypothetical protein